MDTIYVQLDRKKQVKNHKVYLGEIAEIYSSNGSVLARAKAMHIFAFSEQEGTHVFDAIELVEKLQDRFENVDVVTIGEPQILVEYHEEEKCKEGRITGKACKQWIKILLVSVILFFGSAFAIMTYNTDVNTKDLFHKMYYQFTGEETDGFTVIEATYSLGMAVGIITFFTRGKKKGADPTPLQVEMSQYEKQVDETLLAERRS